MTSLGMSHVTLTEHGNLNSAAEVWRTANKHGMKVVHGIEAYIYWPEENTSTYHMTIWFKTQQAYEAYCKLTPLTFSSPRAKTIWGDIKAVMTWDDFLTLVPHGIMVGTGCIGSWMNSPIYKDGNAQEAKKRLELMIATVGVENIWGEVVIDDLSKKYDKTTQTLIFNECKPWMDSPDLQKKVNEVVLLLCRRYGIKLLASQDAHYSCQEDKIIQDTKTSQSNWVMSYFQHMKGAEEYAVLAKRNHGYEDKFIEELIDNTHDFVDSFNDYKFLTVKERGFLIPNPYADSKAEIYKRINEVGRINLEDPVYKERLEYEMEVLSSNAKLDGLGYMLLGSDIVNLAKKNNVLMNTRGSAGGSLLVYSLGMSVTDPIIYELQFERFLTRGRILAGTPPDIDCLTYNNRILTANNEYMSIEELIKQQQKQIGIFNETKKQVEKGIFFEVIDKGKKECFLYELDDGSWIECTANHQVLTKYGYFTIEECYEKQFDIVTV